MEDGESEGVTHLVGLLVSVPQSVFELARSHQKGTSGIRSSGSAKRTRIRCFRTEERSIEIDMCLIDLYNRVASGVHDIQLLRNQLSRARFQTQTERTASATVLRARSVGYEVDCPPRSLTRVCMTRSLCVGTRHLQTSFSPHRSRRVSYPPAGHLGDLARNCRIISTSGCKGSLWSPCLAAHHNEVVRTNDTRTQRGPRACLAPAARSVASGHAGHARQPHLLQSVNRSSPRRPSDAELPA